MFGKLVHGVIKRGMSPSKALNGDPIRGLKYLRTSDMMPKWEDQKQTDFSLASRVWKGVDSASETKYHSRSSRTNSMPPSKKLCPNIAVRLQLMAQAVDGESKITETSKGLPYNRMQVTDKNQRKKLKMSEAQNTINQTSFLNRLMGLNNVRTSNPGDNTASATNKSNAMINGKLRNFSVANIKYKEDAGPASKRNTKKASVQTSAHVDKIQQMKQTFSKDSKHLEMQMLKYTKCDSRVCLNDECKENELNSSLRKKSKPAPTETHSTREYGALSATQRLARDGD